MVVPAERQTSLFLSDCIITAIRPSNIIIIFFFPELWDRVSLCRSGWLEHIAILLPWPPQNWDYRSIHINTPRPSKCFKICCVIFSWSVACFFFLNLSPKSITRLVVPEFSFGLCGLKMPRCLMAWSFASLLVHSPPDHTLCADQIYT